MTRTIDWQRAESELLLYLKRVLDADARTYASLVSVSMRGKMPGYERVLIEDLIARKIIRTHPEMSGGLARALFNRAHRYTLTPAGFDAISEQLDNNASWPSKLESGEESPAYFRHLLGTRTPAKQAAIESASEIAPAADRVVTFSDNEPKVGAIDDTFSELETVVRETNDAFPDSETRELAKTDAAELRTTWLSRQIALDSFKERAQRVLSWIADKASAAAVTEICKKLITLILGL